uniref:Uncharacterized protein n=1 Tax=Paulinella chromatophora TaxID=39717 RepID=B1X528_PAUCH|nr:hypothetical protein PCC_0619 [Paulinella chromatophora]ACB43047.1 hypothetical protein PCC_0619 [Paulinella chromatophora]
MATIQDRAYVTACSQLACLLSISLAAARRKVDYVAAKEGLRDNVGRLMIAERILTEVQSGKQDEGELLDSLLKAVKSEENFLLED